MNQERAQRALDDVFDQALVYHAFTPYMRDYEAIVYVTADPGSGIPPRHQRYLFRYCVEASIESTVDVGTWRDSLDERLIRNESGVDLDGYVWGVNWQVLYPGMALVSPSARAQRWAEKVGIEFHEIRIEANAHRITLVFSDLEVSDVAVDYAPFVVAAKDQ